MTRTHAYVPRLDPLCPVCGHPAIDCSGGCLTPEAAARDYELRMKYTLLQVTTHEGQTARVAKRSQGARRQAREVRRRIHG